MMFLNSFKQTEDEYEEGFATAFLQRKYGRATPLNEILATIC